MPAGPARSRYVLLGLFVVFTAPVLLALVFYLGVGSWFVPGTVNRATLLDPPRLLPTAPIVLVNGEPLPADYFDRRWTLIHLTAGGCAEACAAALQAMRQAHLVLGRHRTRVQRLLLVPIELSAVVETDHPVARATPAWQRVLRASDMGEDEAEAANGTWLVDPRRFVVSYFPAGTGPRAIKRDLTRLLKLSKWQTG